MPDVVKPGPGGNGDEDEQQQQEQEVPVMDAVGTSGRDLPLQVHAFFGSTCGIIIKVGEVVPMRVCFTLHNVFCHTCFPPDMKLVSAFQE